MIYSRDIKFDENEKTESSLDSGSTTNSGDAFGSTPLAPLGHVGLQTHSPQAAGVYIPEGDGR